MEKFLMILYSVREYEQDVSNMGVFNEHSQFLMHLIDLMDERFVICIYDISDVVYRTYIPKNKSIKIMGKQGLGHEIAHLIESQDKEHWTTIDFGMSYFYDLTGILQVEQLLKEVRTLAIESVIDDKNTTRDVQEIVHYLDKTYNGNMHKFCFELYKETKQQYSLDRILSDYKVRMKYLTNWLDKQQKIQ